MCAVFCKDVIKKYVIDEQFNRIFLSNIKCHTSFTCGERLKFFFMHSSLVLSDYVKVSSIAHNFICSNDINEIETYISRVYTKVLNSMILRS